MVIITESDREFFEQNGYVKIPGAVPEENCEAVIEAIWEFMGKDRDDSDEWYTPPEGMNEHWAGQSGGMVELYHHQSLWNNRQHPRVYQAFAEVLGEENLWVSIDRCNMTPPRREEYLELNNEFIHWDIDTTDLPSPLPKPCGVQGVLYLDDTDEEQGGFQCVPSIYREIEDYIDSRSDDADPFSPDLAGHEIVTPPGEKGDLVIWDRLLPHGNGQNHADSPRFAQYILMEPAAFWNAEKRERRIESWRERETPATEGYQFPGDPREREKQHEIAELTPLGRKLLGLDPWPGWLDADTEGES